MSAIWQPMILHVGLTQPVKLELVDEEIIAVAGCDLGFIMPGKPLQVLQVDQGSELAAHGIRADDMLVAVNGDDARNARKDDIAISLRGASSLTFERSVPAGNNIEVPSLAPERADVHQATESAEHVEPLRTGMKVRLVGFKNTGMNGKRGLLGKFSESKGIWQVFIEPTNASKAVRPQNLEADEDGGAACKPNQKPPLVTNPMVATMAAAIRTVVPSPALQAFDGPGPPPGPEWQEDVLPNDDDRESWLELLRHAQFRQIRADAEHPEPPPFHRAHHFAASSSRGRILPEGKFPNEALSFQLQMLFRTRSGDFYGYQQPQHVWYGRQCYWGGGGHYGRMPVGGGRGTHRWSPTTAAVAAQGPKGLGSASLVPATDPSETPRVVPPPPV